MQVHLVSGLHALVSLNRSTACLPGLREAVHTSFDPALRNYGVTTHAGERPRVAAFGQGPQLLPSLVSAGETYLLPTPLSSLIN